ncbi:MAG: hypothetical protein AVDCRST_MAG30-2254, partial [uncultured Solirubrobacteraceae bacterium]
GRRHLAARSGRRPRGATRPWLPRRELRRPGRRRHRDRLGSRRHWRLPHPARGEGGREPPLRRPRPRDLSAARRPLQDGARALPGRREPAHPAGHVQPQGRPVLQLGERHEHVARELRLGASRARRGDRDGGAERQAGSADHRRRDPDRELQGRRRGVPVRREHDAQDHGRGPGHEADAGVPRRARAEAGAGAGAGAGATAAAGRRHPGARAARPARAAAGRPHRHPPRASAEGRSRPADRARRRRPRRDARRDRPRAPCRHPRRRDRRPLQDRHPRRSWRGPAGAGRGADERARPRPL